MREVHIINRSRPLAAPLGGVLCDSFWCKLRGLALRAELPAGRALILVERGESRLGTSVHMLGMFFDLGIVWLDGDLQVVDVRVARRWRSLIVPRKAAQYVLEFGLERLPEFALGDQIAFEEIPFS